MSVHVVHIQGDSEPAVGLVAFLIEGGRGLVKTLTPGGLLEPRPPPGAVFPRLKPGQGEA